MSIDTERVHKLKGKGFDKLYESAPGKFREMAYTALKYAQTYQPEGEPLKIGDVVSVVQNAVRIDPAFEAHLKQKKLTQKFWLTYFSEFIIDKVFPQPNLKAPSQ